MHKRIMLTTTTCDNKYLDVMKVFLYGLRTHCHDKTFLRADLINGTPDIYDRLHRIYENMEICHYDFPTGRDWTKNDNMLLLMWSRIPTMWKALNEGWDQVMTIDSDITIRRSMDSIWDGVKPGLIKIWERKKKKIGQFTKVQAGVHIFGVSKEILEYYKDFMEEIGPEWEFTVGQAAIYTVYLKHKDKIGLIQMPQIYNDSKFKDDSIIWHCKHGHFDNPKFQKEFQSQLEKANKIYEE